MLRVRPPLTTMLDKQQILELEDQSRQLERLQAIIECLRNPQGGCPWDIEQTHQSILSNLIEECYELVASITRLDMPNMREELGDVLLQVVFHASIAKENSHFDLQDVAREVCEKLIRRHPHVFGEVQLDNTGAVLNQWQAIKQQEKAASTTAEPAELLGEVNAALPALQRAVKIQKKAADYDFDWPHSKQVLEKVREELEELAEHADNPQGCPLREEEFGDLMFALVNYARKVKIDPELALARANEKFIKRFEAMGRYLQQHGSSVQQAGLAEMEQAWEQIKKQG